MKNQYLRHGHVSEGKFRAVLKCFAHAVPARAAARWCGVNKNTAPRLDGLLRLRLVVPAAAEAQPSVSGLVEMEECYFGPRRVRGQRGRGAGRKIPVIGWLKRAGKVFPQIVRNGSKTELRTCSKSFQQNCQESQVNELQAGMELAFAILP
jgi:hypothetical protein